MTWSIRRLQGVPEKRARGLHLSVINNMATCSSMKRPRGSPTGTTPVQAEKKRVQKRPEVQHGARRVLARSYPPRTGPGTQTIVPGSAWSNQETLALVDYILSCKLVKSDWPKTTDMDFWSRASKFVQDRANSTHTRTGTFVTVCIIQYSSCTIFIDAS